MTGGTGRQKKGNFLEKGAERTTGLLPEVPSRKELTTHEYVQF